MELGCTDCPEHPTFGVDDGIRKAECCSARTAGKYGTKNGGLEGNSILVADLLSNLFVKGHGILHEQTSVPFLTTSARLIVEKTIPRICTIDSVLGDKWRRRTPQNKTLEKVHNR